VARTTVSVAVCLFAFDLLGACGARTGLESPDAGSSASAGTTPRPSAVSVALGGRHACALLADRTVKCWGDNNYGQLGDGNGAPGASSATPVRVAGLSDVVGIAAGENSSCAILSDATVRWWGRPAEPAAPATAPTYLTPVALAGLHDIVSVAIGGDHACALRSDGTVACWGDNSNYELGNTSGTSATPMTVAGLTGVTAIAAGLLFSCAVLATGTVRCWGTNGPYALGSPAGTFSATPAELPGVTGATALAVGLEHLCVRLASGAVSCLGNNTQGQLGNGTTSGPSGAVPVAGLAGAAAISAGDDWTTCALLTGGQVDCWGEGVFGQLGNGTKASSAIPLPVLGLTDATGVGVGFRFACAVRRGGGVVCWGTNDCEGLGYSCVGLGDGRSAMSWVPVAVSSL
jgi:alpha-tubulin suppressor-like RCC1 family protein